MIRLRSAWLKGRTCRGLDLRGIGGEAAHHLAGMRGLVERRPQRAEVAEDLGAQVGDHPLAQPVDRIHAGRAGHGQRQAEGDQGGEIAVDDAAFRARETVVHHAAHRQRHGQRGRRRRHERHQGQEQHRGVAPDVGPQ
jgi:hypothetical protein